MVWYFVGKWNAWELPKRTFRVQVESNLDLINC